MKHLTHLPNLPGYRFVGIDRDGNRHNCIVRRDPAGNYSVYRESDNDPCFMSLSGWESHDGEGFGLASTEQRASNV